MCIPIVWWVEDKEGVFLRWLFTYGMPTIWVFIQQLIKLVSEARNTHTHTYQTLLWNGTGIYKITTQAQEVSLESLVEGWHTPLPYKNTISLNIMQMVIFMALPWSFSRLIFSGGFLFLVA